MNNKSILIICISILIGFGMISYAIVSTNKNSAKEIVSDSVMQSNDKYEIVCQNNNIIIFDKENGRMWRKFIESNGGPTDWEKEDLDFLKEDK